MNVGLHGWGPPQCTGHVPGYIVTRGLLYFKSNFFFCTFNFSVLEVFADIMKNKNCRYVDAQFPPLPKSIYLDPLDAERWRCVQCGKNNPLPPVMEPPTTQQEAEQQQQRLNSVGCSCGGKPTHVQQVNIVNRPTTWLRPGSSCDGCALLYSYQPLIKNPGEFITRQCTHYIRDEMTHNTLGSYKVIRDTPRPEDVYQGALGNCWFGGALACVANHHSLVEAMLVTRDYSPIGAYVVQLHHSGSWRKILLDDTFPCSTPWEGKIDEVTQNVHYSRGGHMCYAKAARQSLWVPLVEKAAAKLSGSYGALSGGTLAEALQMFTGYACDTVQLRMTQEQATRKKKRHDQIADMRTQLLLQGKDPSEVPFEDDNDDFDIDIIWSRLLSAGEAGYIMGTACSHEACGSTREHFVEKLGLQTPHAYSVLQVKQIVHQGKVVRLMQFRNPWGDRAPRSWQGAWGSKWSGWTRELQLELGVINRNGVKMNDDMSVFWISLEDAKEYFITIDVCRVHPKQWSRAAATAWLPSDLGPGEHFVIKTYKRTVADFILWQEKHITRESALNAVTSNIDIMFALLRRRSAGTESSWSCVECLPSSFADQISVELVLDGGYEYTVVPFSVTMMQAANLSMRLRRVTLAIYSDFEVGLSKVPSPSWDFTASCLAHAVCSKGKQKKLSNTLICTTLSGRGGELHAVENRSASEDCVAQVDYETSNCVSTLPNNDFSRIVHARPLSRQVCLGLCVRGAGGFHSDVSQHPSEVAACALPGTDLHIPTTYPSHELSWENVPPDAALLAVADAIEARKVEEAEEEEERLMQEALRMSEENIDMEVDGDGDGDGEGDDDLEAALRMSREEAGDDADEDMDDDMLRAIEMSKNDPENS